MSLLRRFHAWLAVHSRHSIFLNLFLVMLLAALISIAFFYFSDNYAYNRLDDYFTPDGYRKAYQKMVQRLQTQVKEKHLSTDSRKALRSWVKREPVAQLRIYKNNKLVYDSNAPNATAQDLAEQRSATATTNYDWEYTTPIQFEDGLAYVHLYGAYPYAYYIRTEILLLILSILLFFLLTFFPIRRRMIYIRTLTRDVKELENGDLNHPVTVKGSDELAQIARYVDQMRQTLSAQIQRREAMIQENQQTISEMSHDLKTPLTALLMYTELLRTGQYRTPEEESHYIEKIQEKGEQIKDITNNLFLISFLNTQKEVILDEASFTEVFQAKITSQKEYLTKNGFLVDDHIRWFDTVLAMSPDFSMRIMDNITSNIIKYAAPSRPVTLSSFHITTENQERYIGLVFRNGVAASRELKESTGIGVKNIKKMMELMGGEVLIRADSHFYQITLLYPVRQPVE